MIVKYKLQLGIGLSFNILFVNQFKFLPKPHKTTVDDASFYDYETILGMIVILLYFHASKAESAD